MMKYKKAKKLKDKEFNRFYGVRHETFQLMCQEVKEVENQKMSGRHSDLTVENQVLLTLSSTEKRKRFQLQQNSKY